MWDLAEVGSIAPPLSLREADDPQRRNHLPRLLAFVRDWSSENEPTDELAHVRVRLRELGAELVIVCEDGAWCFVRDHAPVFCDRLTADLATAVAAYGVASDALFVIDHRDVIRFVHRPEQSLGATLTDALDAAAEALPWRHVHTKLQLVQCSPREWAIKCLVTGCALTFQRAVVEEDLEPPRSFARGTGAVPALARPAITPSDPPSAPLANDEASSRRPTWATLAQKQQELSPR